MFRLFSVECENETKILSSYELYKNLDNINKCYIRQIDTTNFPLGNFYLIIFCDKEEIMCDYRKKYSDAMSLSRFYSSLGHKMLVKKYHNAM